MHKPPHRHTSSNTHMLRISMINPTVTVITTVIQSFFKECSSYLTEYELPKVMSHVVGPTSGMLPAGIQDIPNKMSKYKL